MQESPSHETDRIKQLLDGTEIVYVCTPNYLPILATSLRSLVESGTAFDRVSIYISGKGSYQNLRLDDRILVTESSPLMEGYPYADKLYLCRSRYERVIFLDADTIILKPLQTIFNGNTSDLLARFGSAQYGSAWNQEIWQSNFCQLGLIDVVPMINTGLLIFQNGAHTKLMPHYSDYIQMYLNNLLPPPQKGLSLIEQYALSLTVSKLGLQMTALDSNSHAFGWQWDSVAEAVVFHTGGKHHEPYGKLLRTLNVEEYAKDAVVTSLLNTQLQEARKRIGFLEESINSLQRELRTPILTRLVRAFLGRVTRLEKSITSSAPRTEKR